MANHNITGKRGEDFAVNYLQSLGYQILHRNWRYKHWEIDIIAVKNTLLHFIEVKTVTSLAFGYPEERISRKKMQYLINAATEYLYLNPQWHRIQYDALSITIIDGKASCFFIEDIFL